MHDTREITSIWDPSIQMINFGINDVKYHPLKATTNITGDLDAAIITLPYDMTLSPSLANPICLPHGLTDDPHIHLDKMVFIGWGKVNKTDTSKSRKLKKATVWHVNHDFCNKIGKPNVLTET